VTPPAPPAEGEIPPAPQAETFDAWLAKQPQEVQALYHKDHDGLHSALKSERDIRKEQDKKLKRLEELEKADQDRQKASLSEADKLKQELAEANKKTELALAEAATVRMKTAVLVAAGQMGFQNPDDAYDLIQISRLEVGDGGKVSGVDDALKDLAKAKPYLLKKPGAPGLGPTNPAGAQGQRETDADRMKRLLG
jgi:hypothetical protein